MPTEVSKIMRAEMIGDRFDLVAALFASGSDTCEFRVKWDGDLTFLKVRISGVHHEPYSAVMPYRIVGVVEEINGREWESLDAHFELRCNYDLEGGCTVGAFPDGER